MMPPPPPKPLNGKVVEVEVDFDLMSPPPPDEGAPNNLDVVPDLIIVDDDAGASPPPRPTSILVPPKLRTEDALPLVDSLTLPVDGAAEDEADAPKPPKNGRDDAVVVGCGAADAADDDDDEADDGNDDAKDEPNMAGEFNAEMVVLERGSGKRSTVGQ